MGQRRKRQPEVSFTCVACSGMFAGHSAATIQESDLCKTCFDDGLRPQFEAYLKDESAPVMWAGQAVPFDAVRHQFSSDFTRLFLERMEEYAVTPRQRIYCECGKFMGKKTASKASVICSSCTQKTCTHCSATLDISFLNDTLAAHTCTEQQADDAFQGLQIGRDWQKCPKCETPVNLREACNHMTCPLTVCRTHFCYICGVEAHPDDGTHHWGVGRPCPLYGQPLPLPMEAEPDAEHARRYQDFQQQMAIALQAVQNDAERLQLEEIQREFEGARQRLAELRALRDAHR